MKVKKSRPDNPRLNQCCVNEMSMKHFSDFTIQVAWLRCLADGAVLFLCDARPQACRPEN